MSRHPVLKQVTYMDFYHLKKRYSALVLKVEEGIAIKAGVRRDIGIGIQF